MPRLPRVCPLGITQHIIQRGNNRQICFAREEDFAVYANWLGDYSVEFGVEIHAWVFMTHVDVKLVDDIRDAVNSGLVLGSEHFKNQIESLHNIRTRSKKLGRPSTSKV